MSFSETLLRWYDTHRRVLPWRGAGDVYPIWLSEIMLQQTRTETVARYYPRFLERFPDVHALARAEEAEVLKMWEGLGYYSRARNLHRVAMMVSRQLGGRFPQTASDLRSLPGIGPYAANAIASIAFDERVPALDGNQARVLSRILLYESPLKTPFDLEEAALALMPEYRAGDYNQALMDLGAGICTARRPQCDQCPVREFCAARNEDPESFPRRKTPLLKREELHAIVLVQTGDGLCLRRRSEPGLLCGLYEFVALEGHPDATQLPDLLRGLGFTGVCIQRTLPPSKHVFTHLIWRMQGWLASADGVPEGYTVAEDLAPYAFPSALRVYRAEAEALLHGTIGK